uniref:Uncharacterized protein n=1 Tax=Peronospora matthiolae TaxID=2874970 RepID=A0AAV1UM50_9STRA
MGAGIILVPVNEGQASAALGQSGANDVQSVVALLEMAHVKWDEYNLGDGVVQSLHN